ncbi:hypothetical protein D3C73_1085860 [compost metagenome]
MDTGPSDRIPEEIDGRHSVHTAAERQDCIVKGRSFLHVLQDSQIDQRLHFDKSRNLIHLLFKIDEQHIVEDFDDFARFVFSVVFIIEITVFQILHNHFEAELLLVGGLADLHRNPVAPFSFRACNHLEQVQVIRIPDG